MTEQDRAFIEAILAEPGSPVHKLAYADWLREPERDGRHWMKATARARHADAWEWMARTGRMFYASPQSKSASWMRCGYRRLGGTDAAPHAAALPRAVFACLPKGRFRFTGTTAVGQAISALAEALAECRLSGSLEYRA